MIDLSADCEWHNMFDLKIIRKLEDLETYKFGWNRLAFDSAQKVPELSHAWLSSHLEHSLEQDDSWMCLLALKDSHLIGVLPLIQSGNSLRERKSLCLRMPNDLQTQSVDIIADREYESEVIPFLLASLNVAVPGWQEVRFRRISEYSPLLKYAAKKSDVFSFLPDLNGYGGYLKIQNNYDNFFAGLGARFRRNIRRTSNKLKRLSGVKAYRITEEKACQSCFDEFIKLEGSGWKGRRGTSIKDSPINLQFYRTLTMKLSENGLLEWHFLEAEGQSIGALLAVKSRRVLHIPKIAYDENYAFCSPGHLVVSQMLEWAFNDGDLDEVNFMTDAAWLSSWHVNKRKYFDLQIYPRSFGNTLLKVMPFKAKAMLRQIPGIRPVARAVRSIIRK